MDITLAQADQADALSAFAHASFNDTFPNMYPDAHLATFFAQWNTPDHFRSIIADPAWRVTVAHDADGAIAGFMKTGPVDFPLPGDEPAEGLLELHNLYLAPTAKGTGLAHRMMTDMFDHARTQGFRAIVLSVWVNNHRAQRFYARYGFREIGRNAYIVGDTVDDDRIWKRDL